MKKFLTLILLSFVLIQAQAQRSKLRIAYVDMEMILDSMPEYQQALKELDLRVSQWKTKLDRMQRDIDRLKKELEAEKLMLTEDLVKEKEEVIAFKQKQMEKFQMEKFGPQGDLVIQKLMIVKPVQDKVYAAVKKLVDTRHYDIVFDKSNENAGLIHVNPKMDITPQVLRILRKEKQKEERKQKRSSRRGKNKTGTRSKKQTLREKYEERRKRLLEEKKKREAELKAKEQENKEEPNNEEKSKEDKNKN